MRREGPILLPTAVGADAWTTGGVETLILDLPRSSGQVIRIPAEG
jgi:hypothetical protein